MNKIKTHYPYRNLSILALGIALATFLYQFEEFHRFLLSFGSLGYVGAFLAGILFVSSFSVATAAVILLVLAEKLLPLELALFAGAGAVVGDLIIFKFVKDELVNEVKPLFERFGGKHLIVVLHTKYFSWTLPVIGAIIIASPLPDEIGVSLMGLSKIKTINFLLLSFALNSIGIFLVLTASLLLKP